METAGFETTGLDRGLDGTTGFEGLAGIFVLVGDGWGSAAILTLWVLFRSAVDMMNGLGPLFGVAENISERG